MTRKQAATLQDILAIKLRALYDIEKQLVKALPAMVDAAADAGLRKAFADHFQETKEHVRRLEEISAHLGLKLAPLKVEAIRGLIKDATWVIRQKLGGKAQDAMLVGAASYVEHYEMAGYIALRRWAVRLGSQRIADLLQMTLDEEEEADDKLRELAEMKLDRDVEVAEA